ncbi:MAG: hypothetical protein ABI402_14240 [Ferruginibacter sp.]
MPFFDFHLHPSTKGMFSQDSSKTNPWQTIDIKSIPWAIRWCSDFQYIIGSQSNFSQLVNAGANIVCIAVIAPERGITEDTFINKQAKGTLSRYLDPVELEIINNLDTSPYRMILDDLKNVIMNPGRFGITDKKIILLNKGVNYDIHDHSSIYVTFTVEGAHSLGNNFDKEKITATDVLHNLDDLIQQGFPILSINLTHLEQYNFCCHAYGILFVNSENFKPVQKEVTEAGIDIIKGCYQRGIMIDMKHLSLGARRFLVENLRKQADVQSVMQPLICTHAGFTGISYKDIPDYIEYKAIKNAAYSYLLWNKPKLYQSNTFTSFNPSSINLYDDDILAILQSGGMIGLSLDKRILGYSEPSTMPDALNDLVFEEEYISNQEKQYFITKRSLGNKMNEEHCITTQEVLEGGSVNPEVSFYHLCHFMSHVLHFIKVATDNNYDIKKALTQICIGSDFDGFINPVWCCPTIESIGDFKIKFSKEFPGFARSNRDVVKLPADFDILQFTNQLFFENGKNFILNRQAI